MHAGSHGRALCVIRIYTSFTYLTYLCHSADVLSVYGLAVPLFLSLSHPRHFSGLLTPFSYLRPYLVFLLLFVVFSSPFLSLSLSFFLKWIGWTVVDFLADVGRHMGRDGSSKRFEFSCVLCARLDAKILDG